MEASQKKKSRYGKKPKMNWAQRRKMARRSKQNKDTNYELTKFSYKSIKFELYYRRQLDCLLSTCGAETEGDAEGTKDRDFQEFCEFLRRKLPITFRINPLNVGFETLTQMFGSETIIKDWRARMTKQNEAKQVSNEAMQPEAEGEAADKDPSEDLDNLKFTNIEFYPDNLLYQIPISRETLRKNEVLQSIHKFMQMCNDSGLLTRQEIVSMIPPLLLDVRPGHKIFDA
mmetsp:Transcript_19149/g.22101  ORF Transcript_19149/g.22101 Transcript_19149/m.22101 type:complete len:229 (+) Transcript_19149:21-707(+)